MGIAIGFLVPPILVPNVDDVDELEYHIRTMFYITAGVATALFILVIIGKTFIRIHRLTERVRDVSALCSFMQQQPTESPFECRVSLTVTVIEVESKKSS